MHRRFLALGLALTLATIVGALPVDRVLAQGGGSFPEAPDKLPKPKVDHNQDINFLFEALKAAPDDESAKAVENRIWALWFSSGSDTTDLLMSRVKAATEAKETDLAIELLDKIIAIKP